MPKSKNRKPKKKSKRRKSENVSSSGGGGGYLMGMRGGFKDVADSVTGKSKKTTWFDHVLTVITVLLAAYLFYKVIYPRFF